MGSGVKSGREGVTIREAPCVGVRIDSRSLNGDSVGVEALMLDQDIAETGMEVTASAIKVKSQSETTLLLVLVIDQHVQFRSVDRSVLPQRTTGRLASQQTG